MVREPMVPLGPIWTPYWAASSPLWAPEWVGFLFQELSPALERGAVFPLLWALLADESPGVWGEIAAGPGRRALLASLVLSSPLQGSGWSQGESRKLGPLWVG